MRSVIGSLLVVLACAFPGHAQDSIEVDGYAPQEGTFWVEGKPARFRFTGDSSAQLKAIYRPNSEVSETEPLAPGADGWVEWTPKYPGIATLVAYVVEKGDDGKDKEKALATRTVSVRFESLLGLGVVVMLLAGVLLFGGAYLSIRSLLRANTTRLQA